MTGIYHLNLHEELKGMGTYPRYREQPAAEAVLETNVESLIDLMKKGSDKNQDLYLVKKELEYIYKLQNVFTTIEHHISKMDCAQVLVLILKLHFKDLPLLINHRNESVTRMLRWRLENNI